MNATDTAPTARVTWSDGAVTLHDVRVFGPGGERPCERFLGRVLGVEGVRSVSLDRSQATATIRHDAGPRALNPFLARLSAAIRDDATNGSIPPLPRSVRDAVCTVHRHGSLLSTCEVVSDRPGRLCLRHPALQRDRARARQAEQLLATVPGVHRATFGAWSGGLRIHYDPSALPAPRLIRLVEEILEDTGGWGRLLPAPTQTRFGLANTTLGVAALTDFVAPLLMPVSAVLMVGTNFRTFHAAGLQARRGKYGLPALYTVIVVATLASGQFLASALMSWCFKFWHGRLREELSDERRRLLDECLPRPNLACLLTAEGEVLVPLERLQKGDRITVGADETVPADGRILQGEGIVDERSVRGLDGASRKRPGDAILAGSTVLAGSLRIEVGRAADQTRASTIVRSLVAATSPAAGPLSPSQSAEAFADRTVAPTLAAAGVGLLFGGLTTAGAILRPDYATGPGLTGPLETLRNAALCSRRGIVVREPRAFERLAHVDLIVLADHPALAQLAPEVRAIRAGIPEADVLRYAASAFRHLADGRASALDAACRERSVHRLDLPPVAFDPGITILHGPRRILVREYAPDSGETGPLLVEIDGTPVGHIEFGSSSVPEAALALRRIREGAGVPVALVSERAESEVAALASGLGVDAWLSDLSSDSLARFLRDCRGRGLRTAFVGPCRHQARAVAEAHVAVSLIGDDDVDWDSDPAAVLLLQPRLERFADLWEIARSHEDRVLAGQRFVLVPNVFCVAGAFLLGFTGLTAVMISNLGTLGLYSRAVGSLHEPVTHGRVRPRNHTLAR